MLRMHVACTILQFDLRTILSLKAVLTCEYIELPKLQNFQARSTMHSCAHASLGSTFLGNTKAFRASPCNAVRGPISRRRVGVVAKIDTGYKKQVSHG